MCLPRCFTTIVVVCVFFFLCCVVYDTVFMCVYVDVGGPVAMLKWAKGSKNGSSGPASTARVSLGDLKRASARLLGRKDSSKSKTSVVSVAAVAATPPSPMTRAAPPDSPPPPQVPRRCSSHGPHPGTAPATPATPYQPSMIKQATVRRMSTLRQTQRPNGDRYTLRGADAGDADSISLYMQLDKIPVAVQTQLDVQRLG